MGKESKKADERREYWAEHLKRCAESGLSQAEYCRQTGLRHSSFTYWKSALRSESTTREESEFVEIPISSKVRGVSGRGLVELRLEDDYRLTLSVSPELLRQLFGKGGRS